MDSIDDNGQAGHSLTAGGQLRSAREAAGLSRSDIAFRTKIAERHLLAIEEDRFGDLAARTYAVGFARAYARALDLDETAIAESVRGQLDLAEREREDPGQSFEPGDPARVPPARLAWLAGGGALLVIVLLLVFWRSYLSPAGTLPDLLPDQQPAPTARAPLPAASPRQQAVDGPIVLTATDDNLWLEVTSASGERLLLKTMAKGQSWTVPATAQGPMLRTGRPDALRITVGGRAIAPLSEKAETVSGISLTAADLLGRGAAPAPTPAVNPTASPAATRAPAARRTPSAVTTPAAKPPAARPTPGSTTPPAVNARPVVLPTRQPAAAQQPAAASSQRPAPARSGTATMPAASGISSTPTPPAVASPAVAVPSPRPASAAEPVSTDSE